jgi:hypothetical protein
LRQGEKLISNYRQLDSCTRLRGCHCPHDMSWHVMLTSSKLLQLSIEIRARTVHTFKYIQKLFWEHDTCNALSLCYHKLCGLWSAQHRCICKHQLVVQSDLGSFGITSGLCTCCKRFLMCVARVGHEIHASQRLHFNVSGDAYAANIGQVIN